MRFFRDIKKYHRYIWYSTKSELKNEVAGSYLNWLWWFLDPIFFMLVYTFIAQIVFKSRLDYFPVFVFIGLTIWNFFNKVVSSSVKVVKANKGIVSKIYIPKHVLLLIKMGVNMVKMLISFSLVIVLMIIFGVPWSLQILHFLPVLLVLVVVTFAASSILLHLGVFIEDMSNIIQVLLRFTFYMSGVFYSITIQLPKTYGRLLLACNPLAALIDAFRRIMLNGTPPDYRILGAWLLIGLLVSALGVHIIYRHENSYAKII